MCTVVDEREKAAIGRCRVLRVEVTSSSSSTSGVGGFVSTMSRRSRQTAWNPPCSQASSPSKPSDLNLRRRPWILDDSPANNESASYTRIRDALRHAENRALDTADGNIADSRWSEKSGRLRRVDGTEREMARGIRAEEKAA